ncbi:hypothetical protein STAS_03703 [Striga asiatica]|uniref:Netrin receptor DCC n=1 Tax=Striga asiatica TaxID=4170 RepID=A0A5A7P5E1_STRAF|nr:hypothetical protein STAS_03703 [Striga asiatica]
MSTFTAIAFDRLIEPGASNSTVPARNSLDSKLEWRHSPPNPSQVKETVARTSNLSKEGIIIPVHPKLDNRKNGSSTTATSAVDKKHHWTQISPALYTTPESTPVPDTPSSFPPSPYIINHKRRGPRLVKSLSEDDVVTCKQSADEIKADENGINGSIKVLGYAVENCLNGSCNNGILSQDVENGQEGEKGVVKSFSEFSLQQEDGEADDDNFVDPQESMSVKSICESEGNCGAEQSLNLTMPLTEFYDAWEELSSESEIQLQMPDLETELREIRLSLLMEIEKRKQAEEALCNIQNQWQRICEKLSVVGLTLSVDPTTLLEGEQQLDDPAEELCQQVHLARFVSNSIGRGIAKAEVELEMEAQLKMKNTEIARLLDRLHYYEAMNREMSQRNQEVVETARRLRQRRKRKQKWVWGSIATTVTLGSAFLAYSYFYTGKTSSSQSLPHIHTFDRDAS